MSELFPRTEVAGISLSRMIIGTNWMLGYSHTGAAADKMILDRHQTPETLVPMLTAFLENGVDTMMGVFSRQPIIAEAANRAMDKTGVKMHLIDTPSMNVIDSKEARAEANAIIKKSAELGCEFCFLHHSSVEQLVSKLSGTIDRLDDYTAMIRDAGMIPGMSAHMPEIIVYSDNNNYDVETYIQLYNCAGFLMQIEVESVARIIHNAKKPVMTIKPMAAGRVSPFVGLNFVWNTLRECDMVTVGCFTEAEVYEDIEISRAAIERRLPYMAKRSSPNQSQAAFGK